MILTRVKLVLFALALLLQCGTAWAVITASFDNPFFSPNNDTVKDTTKITATVTGITNPTWTLNIVQDSNGQTLVTHTQTINTYIYTWNGKNGSTPYPDGTYSFNLQATNGTTQTATRVATLDNALPTGGITDPTSEVLSNVYQSGSDNVPISGTAVDTNRDHWELHRSFNLGAYTNTTISPNTGTTGTVSAVWDTTTETNGAYQLRLKVFDKAGNVGTFTVSDTLYNFKVTQNVYDIKRDSVTSETVTYTSTVPNLPAFQMTLKIHKGVIGGSGNAEPGPVVRTLFSGARSAGTYNDVWEGLGNGPTWPMQPDSPYLFTVAVSANDAGGNPYSATYDISNEFLSGTSYATGTSSEFKPFENQPLIINYSLTEPRRVTIRFTKSGNVSNIPPCQPGTTCPYEAVYRPRGAQEFRWAGLEENGIHSDEYIQYWINTTKSTFSKNTVVLYGRAAKVTSLTVTPPYFHPQQENQTIALTFTTFNSQAPTATVTLTLQATNTVLRTFQCPSAECTLAGQTYTMVWNGRSAPANSWVAGGIYTVTATITDSIGNIATGQILTQVQYH